MNRTAGVDWHLCCDPGAATMLQPEPDASGQSRKTTARERLKTACICQISRQGSTHPESLDLTYKERVAGSNPASLTRRNAINRPNTPLSRKPLARTGELSDTRLIPPRFYLVPCLSRRRPRCPCLAA